MKTVEKKKEEKINVKVQTQLPDNRLDRTISKAGKYEITEEDTFKISLCLKETNSRWIPVPTGIPGSEIHWVEFRMWSFSEEINLRKMVTSYDSQKRIHIIDYDALNRIKIQRLMKSWSFTEQNDRLRLFHQNGVLVDECWTAFIHLHPNISRYIIDEMNKVLELNG